MIATVETTQQMPLGGSPDRPAEWMLIEAQMRNPRVVWPIGTSPFEVQAEVNHGRWIVRSPWSDFAALASKTDRRFVDLITANIAIGGSWATVVFPANVDEIEEVLLRRPNPANRHWEPGVTVEALASENLMYGVG